MTNKIGVLLPFRDDSEELFALAKENMELPAKSEISGAFDETIERHFATSNDLAKRAKLLVGIGGLSCVFSTAGKY
jgi:hypothetical protein